MRRWKTTETTRPRKILRRALAAGLLLCIVASGAPLWAEDPPPPPPPAPDDDGPLDRDTDILTLGSTEPAPLRTGAGERFAQPWWDLDRLLRQLSATAGVRSPERSTSASAHRQSP